MSPDQVADNGGNHRRDEDAQYRMLLEKFEKDGVIKCPYQKLTVVKGEASPERYQVGGAPGTVVLRIHPVSENPPGADPKVGDRAINQKNPTFVYTTWFVSCIL